MIINERYINESLIEYAYYSEITDEVRITTSTGREYRISCSKEEYMNLPFEKDN